MTVNCGKGTEKTLSHDKTGFKISFLRNFFSDVNGGRVHDADSVGGKSRADFRAVGHSPARPTPPSNAAVHVAELLRWQAPALSPDETRDSAPLA